VAGFAKAGVALVINARSPTDAGDGPVARER
jgi:hypothetical protein